MVAYSFQKQFGRPILDRTKSQTIRGPRKRHAYPGDDLQLYVGMRTKYCRLLARAKCASVSPILIDIQDGRVSFENVSLCGGELEAFAQLGTELDRATQRQLDRGRRMVELLKQGQYTPFVVTDQIISIFAGTKGHLDDIPVPQVRAFETGMLEYFKTVAKTVRDELDLKKALDAELEKKVEGAVKEFKAGFVAKK